MNWLSTAIYDTSVHALREMSEMRGTVALQRYRRGFGAVAE